MNNIIDNMDQEWNDLIDEIIGDDVNEVDENVVGNFNYQELENLSVAEALFLLFIIYFM